MSLVHDMLTSLEENVHSPLFAKKPSRSGLFVLDMPNEIVSDFYDLKEHVRIANQHGRLNALAIADTCQGEGSSTIATFLAFLMSNSAARFLQRPSHETKKTGTAQGLFDITESDRIFTSASTQNIPRATTDDVFSDWNQSIDSRFAYSKNDDSILLVDANLHNPSIHRYFGVPVEGGLAEIVEQNREWRRVVRPVRDSQLQILTAGQTKLNPVELLGSDRFRSLIQEWKRGFRYVIFDSPAVLNFVDALSLASVVDGVVLVIKAGQTRWDNAQKAKRKLTAARANLLGVTLNSRKMDIPDGLYRRLI